MWLLSLWTVLVFFSEMEDASPPQLIWSSVYDQPFYFHKDLFKQ